MNLKFDIPLPPSTNAMYGYGRGRVYKSKKYTAWQEEAGWAVRKVQASWDHAQWQAAKAIRDGKTYSVRVLLPKDLKLDEDNTIKPVLDRFVQLGLTPDDKHCRSPQPERCSSVRKDRCVVILYPAAEEKAA